MSIDVFNGELPSVIQNPFKLECVTEIHMNYYLSWGRPRFNGSVGFENGNTTGEQKFVADNFVDLFCKIKQFCDELK